MTQNDNYTETPTETPTETQNSGSSFRVLLVGACAVVFVILLVAGYDGSRDLARLKSREAQLEARLRKTEASVSVLRDRISRLRWDPYMLERVAREELGLSRPGEIVVILPRADIGAAGKVTPSSTP